MSEQKILRDDLGRCVGTISTDSSGTCTLRDCSGQFLGSETKDGTTRDTTGRYLGKYMLGTLVDGRKEH